MKQEYTYSNISSQIPFNKITGKIKDLILNYFKNVFINNILSSSLNYTLYTYVMNIMLRSESKKKKIELCDVIKIIQYILAIIKVKEMELIF